MKWKTHPEGTNPSSGSSREEKREKWMEALINIIEKVHRQNSESSGWKDALNDKQHKLSSEFSEYLNTKDN